MTPDKFVTHLARLCDVHSFNQLSESRISRIKADIADKIRVTGRITKADCQNIIVTYCPGTVFVVFEGVDNSDLKTALLLAMNSHQK